MSGSALLLNNFVILSKNMRINYLLSLTKPKLKVVKFYF
jgi:hypothetical protein